MKKSSIFQTGEIKLDESYFSARRVKGKRSCDVSGKMPIFGLLKRERKAYTQIVKNCSVSDLMPII